MKKVTGWLLVALFMLCLPATAFMAAIDYAGEPVMLKPGHIRGAFIWRDGDGFHLRATSVDGENHVFSGIIHSNGTFKDVNDRFFRQDDSYRLSDRDTVEFKFTTDGRTVGLDCDIINGDYLSLELFMDGHKISPMDVYIGREGWHPNNYKFTLDRQAYYESPRRSERAVIVVHEGFWHGYWGPRWHRW